MFGFTEKEQDIITRTLQGAYKFNKAVIFGSRAMGNYKKGSDVDLALWGDDISERDLLKLYAALSEDSILPYEFDLLQYESIRNDALKKHIDDFGICIWKRTLCK